jgi:hypothetical protein
MRKALFLATVLLLVGCTLKTEKVVIQEGKSERTCFYYDDGTYRVIKTHESDFPVSYRTARKKCVEDFPTRIIIERN